MTPIDEATNFDFRSRLVAMEQANATLSARVDALDRWQRQVEIADARADERWKNVDNRFNDLDKKIEKVNGVLTKIMWLFVSAMILGFVAFVINGGLRVS